jgi:hypothetical protein
MAGNPLQKYLPYIKKYATQIWILTGLILSARMYYNDNYIYKWVYSENDFQRKLYLEQLTNYLKEEEVRGGNTSRALH